jgi:hypothetical protein
VYTPRTAWDGTTATDAGFFTISGIALAPNGDVVVLDGGNERLYRFRPDGTLVWQVGGRGKGPGEFEDPRGLFPLGDRLATRDVGGGRLSIWTWSGRFARTVNIETLRLQGAAVWIAPIDTGRWAATTFLPFPSRGPVAALPGALVVASTSAEPDTLAHVSFPGFQVVHAAGATRQLPLPYAPAPWVATSAGIVYLSEGGGYDVIGFGAEGDTVRRLVGPDLRPPVTEAMKDRFSSSAEDSALALQIHYPAQAPAIRSLVAGPGGQLVVETWWRSHGLERWDRWSSKGAYLGSFLLPSGVAHVAIGADRIVGRTEDALDRQRVTAFTPSDSASCPGPLPDASATPMVPPPDSAP